MTPIADLVVHLDLPRLMMYGAATWDWHRMHYDHEWARARNLRGPVVDGQMFGALIARQVREWAGPRARFVELEFQNRGFVSAGDTVTVVSSVVSSRQEGSVDRIEIATHILGEGGRRVVDKGRTVVDVPR